jgi:hypothetical protein
MIYDLLKVIATNHPYSYVEVYEAYAQLNSIDAVLVSIELANINEISLSEATKYMQQCNGLAHT